MTIRGVILGCLLMLVIMALPKPSGSCSFAVCHNGQCTHFLKRFNHHRVAVFCDDITNDAVSLLKKMGKQVGTLGEKTPYRGANNLVYFIVLPLLAVLVAWLRRDPKWLYVAAVVFFSMVVIQGFRYKPGLYRYATDFCIHLGNLTGLTYWGICFLFFIVGIPGAIVYDILSGLYIRWSESVREIEARAE